jgi:hypothetical protein
VTRDPIHLRYEHTDAGLLRIDLSIDSADALYNRFDEPVAYANRNLDPAVVQYLIECATELDPLPFAVWFHVRALPEGEAADHARHGLARYFRYRLQLEMRRRTAEVRRSVLLLGGGAALLAAVTWATIHGLVRDSVGGTLTVQGLTVASWVMLWESFGSWILRAHPYGERIRVFRALAEAEVDFVPTRR